MLQAYKTMNRVWINVEGLRYMMIIASLFHTNYCTIEEIWLSTVLNSTIAITAHPKTTNAIGRTSHVKAIQILLAAGINLSISALTSTHSAIQITKKWL